MSLGLLWPAGLAALAGLLLPLLIHLVRRIETRRTEFAALRWLAAQVPPRRRPRFEERTLLLLRLLLVALLALLLARPVLIGGAVPQPWIVVASGVAAADLPDPARVGTAELRWLAPGFPPLTDAAPAQTAPVASLLRELDASLPSGVALTAIVPEEIAGLDGERVRLSRSVDWRVVAGRMPSEDGDPARGPPRVVVHHPPGQIGDDPGLRYLSAAIMAWDAQAQDFAGSGHAPESTQPLARSFPRKLESSALPLPADAEALIWLGAAPWPAAVEDWIAAGGTALRIAPESDGVPAGAVVLWRSAQTGVALRAWAHGRGRVLALPVALTPAALPELLDPQFPAILRGWLAPVPPPPARALAKAYRPLTGATAASAPATPLQPWLAGAVALLFLLERWLAADPRRGGSA